MLDGAVGGTYDPPPNNNANSSTHQHSYDQILQAHQTNTDTSNTHRLTPR